MPHDRSPRIILSDQLRPDIATTDGIFSHGARERLLELSIDGIIVTNTLPQIRHPKIRRLDVIPLLLRQL